MYENITDMPILAIIIPCYNEELIIKHCASEITPILKQMIEKNEISDKSYFCFVDDGSSDCTWNVISELSNGNNHIKGIRLAYNFGQQQAFRCGMVENNADIYITIDCDLQDDITIIPLMVEKYKKNNVDVVYTVRSNRDTDSFPKKFFADVFYNTYSVFGIRALKNSADFKLVSRKVVDILKQFKECNVYLRGLIYTLGLNYDIICYRRQPRILGFTKFTLGKQLELAVNGITSLSIMPIRYISLFGIFVIICGFIKSSDIFLIGGINLLAIGIIGEYIGTIAVETRNRPKWIISERKNY